MRGRKAPDLNSSFRVKVRFAWPKFYDPKLKSGIRDVSAKCSLQSLDKNSEARRPNQGQGLLPKDTVLESEKEGR